MIAAVRSTPCRTGATRAGYMRPASEGESASLREGLSFMTPRVYVTGAPAQALVLQ